MDNCFKKIISFVLCEWDVDFKVIDITRNQLLFHLNIDSMTLTIDLIVYRV